MDIRSIFTDEEAVSPVIGVILMVAITVILAAVIGAFVLGIGGSQEQVPQASWGYDHTTASGSADTLTVTHKGGDEIADARITVTVDASGSGTLGSWSSTPVTAGSSITYTAGSNSATISSATIVWNSGSSDSTNVIGEWEA